MSILEEMFKEERNLQKFRNNQILDKFDYWISTIDNRYTGFENSYFKAIAYSLRFCVTFDMTDAEISCKYYEQIDPESITGRMYIDYTDMLGGYFNKKKEKEVILENMSEYAGYKIVYLQKLADYSMYDCGAMTNEERLMYKKQYIDYLKKLIDEVERVD